MQPKDSKKRFNPVVYEEAAEWIVELRTGEVDADVRRRLDAWFRASPEHIRAYLELSSIWEDGADPDLDRSHSEEALKVLAGSSSNVVAALGQPKAGSPWSTSGSVPDGPPLSPASTPERRTRRKLAHAAAAAAAVLGTGLYLHLERNSTFVTDVGEQRFERLIDGSTIELNSHSRVRVRFSGAVRDVDLLEGQALFHVAKDSARPFVVHSGTALVRAVGTEFDVYRKATGTVVTVVEGRVAVLTEVAAALRGDGPRGAPADTAGPQEAGSARQDSLGVPGSAPTHKAKPAAAPDAPIYLSAGEQLTVGTKTLSRAAQTDVAATTAWVQHELIFDATPLSEVAVEFNRYNVKPLVIRSSALEEMHVTGIFSSADPASLLRFLRAQSDIAVRETGDAIEIVKR